MATRIIHRRGKGIPKASDFASVGEILIDTDTGTGYTLRETDGVVVALGGNGSSGGSGAGMVISETEPADPETGLQWLEATTGRVWIWDEDKWLEFPAAVPEVESGAPAVHVGDTPPADPVEGMQWLNTDDGFLYIYYDNAGDPTWIAIGGSAGEGGSGGDGSGGDGGDSGDPDWNSVSLLLNGDDEADGSQNIIDATGKNIITVVNNTQIDTTEKKYGTGSIRFNGNNDYLRLDDNMEVFDFGAESFTIEFWVHPTVVSVRAAIFDSRPNSTNGAYATILLDSDGTIVYLTGGTDQLKSSPIPANSWTHVALSRGGADTGGAKYAKLFVDGKRQGDTYFHDQTYLEPPRIAIGTASSNFSNAKRFSGYIDDLRVTKGLSRYTPDKNFTPPEKLPTQLGARVITVDAPENPATQEDSNDADLP